VYALFATAFFPGNGQNIVFALYLFGIVVAVLSAMVVRKHLLPGGQSSFLLELPAYHLPTLKGLLLQTWQRLKGFVMRAGKAIVLVVIFLNVVNSVGTDGSFGNQDSEKSALSAIGRTLTPLFRPMGISDDNWPATVGIFTGIFAKEVVVGTLNALYSPGPSGVEIDLLATLSAAVQSVPTNLAQLGDQFADPLGIGVGEITDVEAAVAEQGVALTTIGAMQNLFDGQLGAFSYLLFILLYMPCVATIGVIFKELGAFWATFSTGWSVIVAYASAVLCYQLGHLGESPGEALMWSGGVLVLAGAGFVGLIHWGRGQRQEDGVAQGHVGYGDAKADLVVGPVLRDRELVGIGERRVPRNRTQKGYVEGALLDAQDFGDLTGAVNFLAVGLAVVKGKRPEAVHFFFGVDRYGGRIQPP